MKLSDKDKKELRKQLNKLLFSKLFCFRNSEADNIYREIMKTGYLVKGKEQEIGVRLVTNDIIEILEQFKGG